MAVLHPDLVVLNRPSETSDTGWILRGELRASFRDLTTALCRPDFGLDAVEESTLWLLDTPAGPAQVHSWLGGSYFLRAPDSVVTWQVQAPDNDVLPWIYKAVTGSTVGFADSVRELAFGAGRGELTQAYLAYLRGREQSVSQRLHEGDLVGPQRIAVAGLWQQLLSTVLTLVIAVGPRLQLLHPNRPADSSSGLAEALNRAAGEVPLRSWHDRTLRDEHIATLRALAAARVPSWSLAPAWSAAR